MTDKTTEPGSFVVLLRALVMLVFLVGLPGAGKTTVGRLVARARSEAKSSFADEPKIRLLRGTCYKGHGPCPRIE